MKPPFPPDDPEVVRRVAEALERRDAGRTVDLEALCGNDPALRAAVSDSLDLEGTLLDLERRARTFDRLVGTRVAGRYRLSRRIGSGAMGHVYRGWDDELDRPVAVKLLRTDLLVGETIVRRFEREAETLGRLRHDNVVTVFDRGVDDDGSHFLVMELLEGKSLSELLESRPEFGGDPGPSGRGPDTPSPRPWTARAVEWTAALADGLATAHAAGIRHRDVKPSNVFVREDGRPILLDFGIATCLDQQTLATGDGTLGTPAYMAPEQVRGVAEPGPEIDVYGLGATLHHMLSGAPPFRGTLSEILRGVERGDPAPLTAAPNPPPRDLRAIVEKAMATSPGDRYPTARALANDLRAFLAYRPVSARPIGPVQRSWRRLRRSVALRAALAAALLVAAVSLAVSSWQDDRLARDHAASLADGSLRPDLSISGTRHARVISDPDERREIRARLDRIVRDSLSPLPGRQRRAVFRLDHGDPAGAAADMAAVAAHYDSPFLHTVAAAYAALPAEADAHAEVTGFDPTRATTPAERYVAGFHLVRNRDASQVAAEVDGLLRANEMLAGDGTSPPLPCADELRLVVLLSLGASSDVLGTRRGYFQAAYDLAQTTGRRLGRGSATIHYTAATSLLGLGRENEAVPEFEQAVACMPKHFGTRLNLGSLLRRLEKFDAAQVQLGEARRLQPFNPRGFENQIRLWIDRKNYAAAAELLASDTAVQFPATLCTALRAELAVARALDAHARRRDREATRRFAEQALHEFEDLAALAPHADPGVSGLLATALANGQPSDAFDPLLASLTRHPAAWTQLGELLAMWPQELDAARSTALRDYLSNLVHHMSPGLHDYLYAPVGPPDLQPEPDSTDTR